uniref:TRAP transporter small permease n=1 Tax=candidate division WOR-3 bacterium TaxID=2052148 RepID=A0A7C2K4W7_UNCW3
MFKGFQSSIRKIEGWCLWVSIYMLLGMMFIGAIDVIGRYLLGKPIKGALEMSQLMMAGVALLLWGYTQAVKGHISVNILLSRYPSQVQKGFKFFGLLLTIFLFILIAWQSWLMAFEVLKQKRMLENLPFPIFPFRLFVPIGAAILCLECVVQFVSTLREE